MKFASILMVLMMTHANVAQAQFGLDPTTPKTDFKLGGSSSINKDGAFSSRPITRTYTPTATPSDLIEISVTGAVFHPDTYKVAATTRLSEALSVAGGLLRNGSERNIEIRSMDSRTRSREVKSRKVDLFQFTNTGDISQNPYLENGDIVYVTFRRGTIQVVGAVKRAGGQELVEGLNLKQAIDNAGGYAADYEDKPLRVLRLTKDSRQINILADSKESTNEILNRTLEPGDLIIVPSINLDEDSVNYKTSETPGTALYLPDPEASVYMVGAFYRPGPFPYNPSLNLQRYIALAGGTNPMAKRGQAYINKSSGEKQKIDIQQPTALQPGDTVVVPEKAIRPEFWPSFILSVGSFVLTAFLTIDRLK